MAEIVLGVLCGVCLYVVWSLHFSYVKSMHMIMDMHSKQQESMSLLLQAKNLTERAEYERSKEVASVEVEELRAAYADEARARLETERLAKEVVDELNGEISVEGVGELAAKKNLSLAEFYRKFEEVV